MAAARKRSHPWCLTLTPNNTETIERMICHCFCDQSGETSRAAPTQLSSRVCGVSAEGSVEVFIQLLNTLIEYLVPYLYCCLNFNGCDLFLLCLLLVLNLHENNKIGILRNQSLTSGLALTHWR